LAEDCLAFVEEEDSVAKFRFLEELGDCIAFGGGELLHVDEENLLAEGVNGGIYHHLEEEHDLNKLIHHLDEEHD
jgi:hypothetical protein